VDISSKNSVPSTSGGAESGAVFATPTVHDLIRLIARLSDADRATLAAVLGPPKPTQSASPSTTGDTATTMHAGGKG